MKLTAFQDRLLPAEEDREVRGVADLAEVQAAQAEARAAGLWAGEVAADEGPDNADRKVSPHCGARNVSCANASTACITVFTILMETRR